MLILNVTVPDVGTFLPAGGLFGFAALPDAGYRHVFPWPAGALFVGGATAEVAGAGCEVVGVGAGEGPAHPARRSAGARAMIA